MEKVPPSKGLVIGSQSATNLRIRAFCDWGVARVSFWRDGFVTFGVAPFEPRPCVKPPAAGAPRGARSWRLNRRRVRASAFALFDQSELVRMYTLTFPASWDNDRRHSSITRFARFLSKKREYYGITGYVWVVEFHKSGLMHAHFLVGFSGPVWKYQRFFARGLPKASVRWCGSENGLDSRLVTGRRQVSAYVSKYVSKTALGYRSEYRLYGAGGVALHNRVMADRFLDGQYFLAGRACGSYVGPVGALPPDIFELRPVVREQYLPGLSPHGFHIGPPGSISWLDESS